MHRTVADNPNVGFKRFYGVNNLLEMRRAGFFLTFEKEFDVH